MCASDAFPAGSSQRITKMFVFITPIVIAQNKEARSDFCERLKNLHSRGQQFRVVDQIAGKDDGIGIQFDFEITANKGKFKAITPAQVRMAV